MFTVTVETRAHMAFENEQQCSIKGRSRMAFYIFRMLLPPKLLALTPPLNENYSHCEPMTTVSACPSLARWLSG